MSPKKGGKFLDQLSSDNTVGDGEFELDTCRLGSGAKKGGTGTEPCMHSLPSLSNSHEEYTFNSAATLTECTKGNQSVIRLFYTYIVVRGCGNE
jgi:hypothetical protein